jgi:transposase-like protein
MGKRTYRRYEAAFKRQLVEQIQAGQLTPNQAAREHQISRSLIDRWCDQYLGKTLVEKPSNRERQLEVENKKLKAKIADLVMEMDHIKKLQAWVQQQRSVDTSVITAKNLDQFRKPAK